MAILNIVQVSKASKYLDRAPSFFLHIYVLVGEYTTSRWYSSLAFHMTILSRAVM